MAGEADGRMVPYSDIASFRIQATWESGRTDPWEYIGGPNDLRNRLRSLNVNPAVASTRAWAIIGGFAWPIYAIRPEGIKTLGGFDNAIPA